jgi:hypothetical protein
MFLAGNETWWRHCTPQTKQAGMQFDGPKKKCILGFGLFYNNEELEISVGEMAENARV